MKRLLEIPAFAENTDEDAIRRGYYLGPLSQNPYRIVPKGPDLSFWRGLTVAGKEA